MNALAFRAFCRFSGQQDLFKLLRCKDCFPPARHGASGSCGVLKLVPLERGKLRSGLSAARWILAALLKAF